VVPREASYCSDGLGSSGLQGRRCPRRALLCKSNAEREEKIYEARSRVELQAAHTNFEASHHTHADQGKPARSSCKDGGGCQGWILWWDEPDQRAGELQGRWVGWEGSMDVVCTADCFLSQLETLKNMTDP